MNSKDSTFMSRLRAIEEATRHIYGSSETTAAIERECAAARTDIAAILSRRGVSHPVIAVIGSKNAGKSTLCRMLMRNPEQRERVAAGMNPEGRTRKVTWIGPEAPADLDKRFEQEIPLSSKDLADLGTPYTLVDVPGFNDDDPPALAAAKRAFRLSTNVVLVASEETYDDSANLRELAQRDGVRVLPVFVTNQEEELREAVSSLGDSIRKACPRSDVLDTVVLPRIGSAEGEQLATLEQMLRTRITRAMTAMLSMEVVDPALLAATRFEKLRETLRTKVRNLVVEVQDEYNHLVETEELVVGRITSELVGNPRQLKAACRLRLLDSLSDRCPPLFFPYRSFLGLLTLAAGAWDRLVFSLLGSLPSLVMTVVQSSRNAKLMEEKRESMRNALAQRAKALASEKLAPASQQFMRAVKRRLPEDAKDRLLMVPPDPVVLGLDAAESAVTSAFEEGIKSHAPRNSLNFSLGLMSLALVIFLSSGPIVVIYRQYFAAWSGGFGPAPATSSELVLQPVHQPIAGDANGPDTGGESAEDDVGELLPSSPVVRSGQEAPPAEDAIKAISWRDFPVPSAGMLFATAMLVFAPAFLLAMISLVLGVTGKRVDRCTSSILEVVGQRLRQLVADKVLRLEVEDPMRDAIRLLFHEAGRPRSPENQP